MTNFKTKNQIENESSVKIDLESLNNSIIEKEKQVTLTWEKINVFLPESKLAHIKSVFIKKAVQNKHIIKNSLLKQF